MDEAGEILRREMRRIDAGQGPIQTMNPDRLDVRHRVPAQFVASPGVCDGVVGGLDHAAVDIPRLPFVGGH